MKLYRFYWDCGRMGDLDGLFVVDDNGDRVLELLLKSDYQVYFGEVLGKHSEVYGTLDADDVELISFDEERVSWLVDLFGGMNSGAHWFTITGYNPLDTLDFDEWVWDEEQQSGAYQSILDVMTPDEAFQWLVNDGGEE